MFNSNPKQTKRIPFDAPVSVSLNWQDLEPELSTFTHAQRSQNTAQQEQALSALLEVMASRFHLALEVEAIGALLKVSNPDELEQLAKGAGNE